MIAVHSQQLLLIKDERKTLLGSLITFMGGAPAAPIFLFLMGYFFAMKGHRTSFLEVARRALLLLVLGYGLNFLRSVVAGRLGAPLPGDLWQMFSMVDILQLAAPCLLLLWLVARAPNWVSWLVILLFFAFSPLVPKNGDTNFLLALVAGRGEFDFFPLFPWAIYGVLGLAWFRSGQPPRALFLAVMGLVGGAWGVSLVHPAELGFTYYHPHWVTMAWILGFVVLWFEGFRKLPWPVILGAPSVWLSSRVTSLYVFSWLWITASTIFLGYREQSMPMVLFMMLICMALSGASSLLWEKVPMPRWLRL
jgi:hypothetical protein